MKITPPCVNHPAQASNQGVTHGSTGIDTLRRRISDLEKRTDVAAGGRTDRMWFNDLGNDKYYSIVFQNV